MKLKIQYHIICTITFVAHFSFGQYKNSDINKWIKQGQVEEIVIHPPKTVYPGSSFSFDMTVKIAGNSINASSEPILFRKADIRVEHGHYQTKGEQIGNKIKEAVSSEAENYNITISSDAQVGFGVGQISTAPVQDFYPYKPLKLIVTLGDKTAEEVVYPTFKFEEYTINKEGDRGSSGTSNVQPGGKGGRGPDLNVEIEEEVINDIPHIIIDVNGVKHPFEPHGKITVISQGGRGGSGGGALKKGEKSANGGTGGDGGTITVSGPALNKYRSHLEFLSLGGKGGNPGLAIVPGTSKGASGKGGQNGMVRIIESNDPVTEKVTKIPTLVNKVSGNSGSSSELSPLDERIKKTTQPEGDKEEFIRFNNFGVGALLNFGLGEDLMSGWGIAAELYFHLSPKLSLSSISGYVKYSVQEYGPKAAFYEYSVNQIFSNVGLEYYLSRRKSKPFIGTETGFSYFNSPNLEKGATGPSSTFKIFVNFKLGYSIRIGAKSKLIPTLRYSINSQYHFFGISTSFIFK